MREIMDRFREWLRHPYNPFPKKENQTERLTRLRRDAEDARLVLESEAHNRAYQHLLSRFADQILETAPDEQDRRESLYLQAFLLQSMVREMAAAVHAYDAERARQNLVENPPT